MAPANPPLPPNPSEPRLPGVNLIGMVTANAGMGVTARNFIRVLKSRGIPVSAYDMNPGFGRGGHDTEYADLLCEDANKLPHPINLAILPVNALPELLFEHRALFESRYNVGFFWWELDEIPRHWRLALQTFDALIAGSRFIESSLRNHLDQVPVVYAPHPLQVEPAASVRRADFGLPEQTPLLVTIVEPTSDPRRKNPFAAIHAFERAREQGLEANLVVKLNNSRHNGQVHPLAQQVIDRCNQAPGVHLVDARLPYPEVLALYANCDVFVSLHSAEGLGLGMLEAMALGKPVIATGWSGNLSFMDHQSAALVTYRHRTVDGELDCYTPDFAGRNATWAAPDIEHAATWMLRLGANRALREALGARAKQQARSYLERAEQARFVDELAALWAEHEFRGQPAKLSPEAISQVREAYVRFRQGPVRYAVRGLRQRLDRQLLWRLRTHQ